MIFNPYFVYELEFALLFKLKKDSIYTIMEPIRHRVHAK